MISGKSISLDNADRLWGMAAVVAAQFFFTTQDMMIKWLSGEYALHQIVLIRAVVGTLLILLVFLPLTLVLLVKESNDSVELAGKITQLVSHSLR